MTEQFTTNGASTLSAAITSTGATTLTVTSAASFPSSGTFDVLIDSEITTVTAVSGTTFTITRAAGGTAAATHANGAAVTEVLTARAFAQLKADTFTAGGDLSGTATSQTVAKINGSTVPAGGSLTTGNTLYVSGSSAFSAGALNLAGGAGYVSGILPVGNHPLFWTSPADQGGIFSAGVAGNFAVGIGGRFLQACTVTGVRLNCTFSGGAVTATVKLVDLTAASTLATATGSVSTGATTTISFSSPVSITSLSHIYCASVYINSSTFAAYTKPSDGLWGAFPVMLGPNFIATQGYFGTGNVAPALANTMTQIPAAEPVFTVP